MGSTSAPETIPTSLPSGIQFRMGKRRRRRLARAGQALVKVKTDAITRVVPAVASLVGAAHGMPFLGPSVSLAVAFFIWLGPGILKEWASQRVRDAVQRAVEENECNEYYQEQLRTGGAERLRRELLEMLRELNDAISDAAVEPLTRLFLHRAKGTVEWPIVRILIDLVRRLTDEEVAQVHAVLAAAVKLPNWQRATIAMASGVVGGHSVLLVANELGDQLEVGAEVNRTVLRALLSSGAATTFVPNQAQASGADFTLSETIEMDRDIVEFALSLFA